MKKIVIVVLIFAVGLLCGIFLNPWKSGEPSSRVGIASPGEEFAGEQNPPSESVDRILIDHFLPDTAPYWVFVDLDRLRKEKKEVSAFFEEPGMSTVWKDFCASLPQGATPALSELIEASQQMRLFLLPPRDESPTPVVLAAFSLSEATASLDAPPGIASLFHSYPNSASEEIKIDSLSVQSIETGMGSIAYLQTDAYLWIGNQKNVLVQFWQQPPPLPENPDEAHPAMRILKDHADIVFALFVNVDHPGEPIPGPLGFLTHQLRPMGMKKASVLFECFQDGAKMTLLSPDDMDFPWADSWSPLDRFPFGIADPAGLVEAAIRWPGAATPQSATAVVTGANSEFPTPVAGVDEEGKTNIEKKSTDEKNQEKRSTRKEQRERLAQSDSSDPSKNLRSHRVPGMRRGDGPRTLQIAREQMRFLSQLFPTGGSVGFNLFGFYDGVPSVALAFPEIDPLQSPLQVLKSWPMIESSTMEVMMLPATQFHFPDNPINRMIGLDDLLLIERDAVTYLFDVPDAAKSYLDGSNRPESRSIEMRSLLMEVKSPAQIKMVFSRDFFRFILDQESSRIPEDFEYRDEMRQVLDALFDRSESLALSAGIDEGQWFMETYTDDSLSHWIDTGLLLWSIHQFIGR